MKLLTILILSVAFLAVNYLLKRALRSIKNRNGIFSVINRYYPIAELLVWGVIIVWAVSALFANSQFLMYIIFLMTTLAFILFFLLFARDYTTGVLLKSRYNLSSGQRFKSGHLRGTIKQPNLLYIEIKGDNGNDYKVPYSQIDQKSLALDFQDSSGGESLVSIELDRNLDPDETAKKIAELTINSPWCSHKSMPKVSISQNEQGRIIYEISCMLIGDHASRNLKELIEKNLAKNSKV